MFILLWKAIVDVKFLFSFSFLLLFGVTVEQLWSLLDLGETLWKNLFRLFITVLILIPDENHI